MYKYTQKNLLENPERYQFSKFEGDKFFKDYIENRQNFLTCSENFNIKEINELYDKNIKLGNSNLYLKNYLINSILESEYDLNIIKKLIQRFEVSKKLYDFYSLPEMRRSSDSYQDIDNYYLFSLYLSIFMKKCKDKYFKIIVFNTLLKINDLIISIHNKYSNDLYNKILAYSLNIELNFFNVLKKGEI